MLLSPPFRAGIPAPIQDSKRALSLPPNRAGRAPARRAPGPGRAVPAPNGWHGRSEDRSPMDSIDDPPPDRGDNLASFAEARSSSA